MMDLAVAEASGLILEAVCRLESFAGPLSSSEEVARNLAACGTS